MQIFRKPIEKYTTVFVMLTMICMRLYLRVQVVIFPNWQSTIRFQRKCLIFIITFVVILIFVCDYLYFHTQNNNHSKPKRPQLILPKWTTKDETIFVRSTLFCLFVVTFLVGETWMHVCICMFLLNIKSSNKMHAADIIPSTSVHIVLVFWNKWHKGFLRIDDSIVRTPNAFE